MKIYDYKYIPRTMKLIFSQSRLFYLLITVGFLITMLSPFISVYLSKYTVEYLSDITYPTVCFLIAIFFFLLVIYLFRTLNDLINSKRAHLVLKLHYVFSMQIMQKCFNATYESVVDKDFIEQKALAVNAYQSDKLTALITDFFDIINSIVIVLGMAYVMKQFSYIVLIVLAIMILINFVTAYFSKKADYQMDQFDTIYNVRTSYLRGTANDFQYAKDIRAFDLSPGFERKLDHYSRESYAKMMDYYNTAFTRNTLVSITQFLFNATLYIYFGYRLLVQRDLSLSDFVFLVGAVTGVYTALQTLTNRFAAFQGNLVYVRDYFHFLDIPSENMAAVPDVSPELKPEEVRTLEIKNLSFRYPGCEEYAIKDLNVTFKSGHYYMIVGANGAGKSTLIKLILRLYDTYTGKILLNGIDIKEIDYETYLTFFTALFQDFTMLPIPIQENIVCSGELPDDVRIGDLIRNLGLSDIINSLPRGIANDIHRIFAADGAEFSGGEMQKLALARVLYKNAEIAIFDEPSSALDVYSEQTVLDCIRQAAGRKIVIYTTHRFSSKNIASEIMVMDRGMVQEQGTHDALMEKKGAYYQMYTLQASSYVKEGDV